MQEVRVGIIGTDNTHAYTYCAFLNGWAEDQPIPVRLPSGVAVPDMYLWATLLRRLEAEPNSHLPIPGIRVTSIWSDDHGDAERVARACGITTVCQSPEQVCDSVDAVMVLSERPETHLHYARPALEQGIRTYVDKPLAESEAAGREIFDVARQHGAPCYTGSAVRWSPEFLAAQQYAKTQSDQTRAVHIQCPLSLELYGIHAIEIANLFLGHDVASVQTLNGPDRQVVLMSYTNGTTAVIDQLHFIRWPTYSTTIYGSTWHHRVALDDPAPTLLAFTRAFTGFARGHKPPVPPAESLRLIDILSAAIESSRINYKVALDSSSAPRSIT